MKNNKEEIKKAILLCKQLNNTFSDLVANNKSLQEIEKKVNLVVMNSNIKSYEEQVSGQTFITIQNSMSYIDDSLLNVINENQSLNNVNLSWISELTSILENYLGDDINE